jgi:hypothetical protein
MKGEREIRVGENRFYLGEDGIMYVELSGEYNEQNAFALRDAYMELLGTIEGKVNILVDNRVSIKPSLESRKIFTKLTEHERCGKIAVCGFNPVARVIASFIIGFSKKDINFFNSKEEALVWLKEQSKMI